MATFSSEHVTVEDSEFDSSITKTSTTFSLSLKPGTKAVEFAAFQWKQKNVEPSDAKALVILCHGYAEYVTDAYGRLASVLAAENLLVIAHDHLGHGRTKGFTQAQTKFDFETDYVGPILAHIKHYTGGDLAGKPVFLVGHSLGGLMSVLTAAKEPEMFKGVVLVSPAVVLDPEFATPFMVFVANCLGSALPWLPLQKITLVSCPYPNIDVLLFLTSSLQDYVTRDKEAIEKMAHDKLRYHGGAKAKNCKAILVAIKAAEEARANFHVPILVQQAEKDKLIIAAGVKDFTHGFASADKQYKEYPDAYHNLVMEPSPTRECFTEDLKKWILERI